MMKATAPVLLQSVPSAQCPLQLSGGQQLASHTPERERNLLGLCVVPIVGVLFFINYISARELGLLCIKHSQL